MTAKPEAIASLFDGWNLALASLDASKVALHYWPDAVVLSAQSATPRTSAAMIREHFATLLRQHPRARIETRTIRSGCNTAIDSGTRVFSLMDNKGATSERAERYTLVYQYREGDWRIFHEHSSPVPVSSAKEPEMKLTSGGSRPFVNAERSPSIQNFYPLQALTRRERGVVGMLICTGPTGSLESEPKVVASSGIPALDEAATEWASAARWVPATTEGKTVAGCTNVEIEFLGQV